MVQKKPSLMGFAFDDVMALVCDEAPSSQSIKSLFQRFNFSMVEANDLEKQDSLECYVGVDKIPGTTRTPKYILPL